MDILRKEGLANFDDISNQKIELIECLKDNFLDNYINLNLKKEQYNNFDTMVKKSYSKIWYKLKSFSIYEENNLWNIARKLALDIFSYWDYLIYMSFKTKDEQYWYTHISLLEWANIINNKDLLLTNKQEFLYFIEKLVINNFLLNIDWLKEIKLSVWKKETLKPINNLSYLKNILVA